MENYHFGLQTKELPRHSYVAQKQNQTH